MRARATQSAGSETAKASSCAPHTALDGFDKSAASAAGWVLTQGCLFKCLFHGIEQDISSSYSNFMGGGRITHCFQVQYTCLFQANTCTVQFCQMHDREGRREVGTKQREEGAKFNFSRRSRCLVRLLNRGRLSGALR